MPRGKQWFLVTPLVQFGLHKQRIRILNRSIGLNLRHRRLHFPTPIDDQQIAQNVRRTIEGHLCRPPAAARCSHNPHLRVRRPPQGGSRQRVFWRTCPLEKLFIVSADTLRRQSYTCLKREPKANNSLQKGSLIAISAIFSIALAYKLAPREGEDSAFRNLLTKYRSQAEHWEEINALHTKAAEQAGFDRNLFENGSNQHRFVDVSYPEYVFCYLCLVLGASAMEVSRAQGIHRKRDYKC